MIRFMTSVMYALRVLICIFGRKKPNPRLDERASDDVVS